MRCLALEFHGHWNIMPMQQVLCTFSPYTERSLDSSKSTGAQIVYVGKGLGYKQVTPSLVFTDSANALIFCGQLRTGRLLEHTGRLLCSCFYYRCLCPSKSRSCPWLRVPSARYSNSFPAWQVTEKHHSG
jgi:hypothetical protein